MVLLSPSLFSFFLSSFKTDLRLKAKNSESLEYFNVQLLGLNGRPYLAVLGIQDTRAASKMRAHLKFLTGDILSFDKLARDRGGNPKCRLCSASKESSQHILNESDTVFIQILSNL